MTITIVPPKAEYDRRNEAEFRAEVERNIGLSYDRRGDLTVPLGKRLAFTSPQGQVITFGYNNDGQFTIQQDANSPFGLASISYVSSVETSLEGQIAVLEVDVEAANDAAAAAASSAISAQTSATNAGNSATAAQTSATNASTSATNAGTSATNASNSASNASTSASQASTSASNAAGSASAAGISATAAAASEFAAAGSATAASGSASNASSSATQAATSASNAAGSASNASTSATNAANSATAAGNSASAASTSASNAATSATNAGNSATSAQNSATSASTQASNAATSASQASTSASNAATSASQASTSASNAAGSASTASTQATNAANSATSAGNSATAASTSASNASTSATNASTSASAAQTSATNAAASATNAAGSASTATTQASNASASAASAASSATLSANYAKQGGVAYTVSDFVASGLFWTADFGGSPTTVADPPAAYSYEDVSGVGRVARVSLASGNSYLQPKAVFTPVVGRKYRVRVTAKVTTDATGGGTLEVGFYINGLTSAFVHTDPSSDWTSSADGSRPSFDSAFTVADGVVNFGIIYTCTAVSANSAYWRMRFGMARSGGTGGVIEIREFLIEEITDIATTNANVATNTSAIATESAARAAADLAITAKVNVNGNRFPHPQPLSTTLPSGWVGTGLTVGEWQPLGGYFYYKARGSGGAATTEWFYYDVEPSNTAYIDTNQQYTLSAVGYGGSGSSGDRLMMRMELLDSGGNIIHATPYVLLIGYAPDQRVSTTTSYVSGGDYVRRRVVFQREWAASGSYQDLVFNYIKLERGPTATAYTADGSGISLQAGVTTNASAIATVDGKLTASYGLTVDANGRIASMKLLSNGTTSSVKFTADTFQIFNGSTDVAPFEVTGGQVKIKSANVGTLNIGSGGLTIQSGSSGARIVISNSVVEVYDATRLRVRLGIW